MKHSFTLLFFAFLYTGLIHSCKNANKTPDHQRERIADAHETVGWAVSVVKKDEASHSSIV